MAYSKKYHTVDQQIKVLERRGIIVDDPSILQKVNYSHLIYVFGKHYVEQEIDGEPKYKSGTKLSYIYNLFLLNAEVSSILFSFFHKFEHKFKFSVAHWLSAEDELWYSKKENYTQYDQESSTKKELKKLYKNLNNLEENKRSKHDPKHYKDGMLPMWLLVDEMSLGQLGMVTKFSNNQSKIYNDLQITSNNYKLPLDLINYRNQIFHGNPLTAKIQTKEGSEFSKLLDVVKYIKNVDQATFNKLKQALESISERNTGLTRQEVEDILKISKAME